MNALRCAAVLLAVVLPQLARAQLLEVHGIYGTGTTSGRTVHDSGASLGLLRGVGPVALEGTIGIDYVREPTLGSGQGSLLASVLIFPNEDAWVQPYAGIATSANVGAWGPKVGPV